MEAKLSQQRLAIPLGVCATGIAVSWLAKTPFGLLAPMAVLFLGKHKVDSETFAQAVKLFGHQGVVNIASLIGDYAATAVLLNVADQHVRDVSLLPVP
jgi:hypothetical protein